MKPKTEILFLVVIFMTGIVFRFYYQFVGWSFNGDEINLGLDIINHKLKGLFYPFKNMQSAPPLFLFLEKLISGIAKPYISLKLLSFLSSCASIFLFNKLLKETFRTNTHLILLALFCINPFILSNSLTLKQYSLDLTMGLIAVNYFLYKKESYKIFLFFCIFCLVSNVGLFFNTAFLIFHSIKHLCEKRGSRVFNWETLKKVLPFFLAPMPYLLFFSWFMYQPGAGKLKNYMVNYWSGAFMPLDLSIFRWLAIQGKVIYFFFFSTYGLIGVPMLILFLIGIFYVAKNRNKIFQYKFLEFVLLYIIVISIHLIISALKMYPFSDRLFLYMAPGIYLMMGFGIEQLSRCSILKSLRKSLIFTGLGVSFCAIISYLTYLPKKSNDVIGLIEFVNSTKHSIVFTSKAKRRVFKWLEFTQYSHKNYSKLIDSGVLGISRSTDDYLISVQGEKFGHTIKYSTPEPEVIHLLEQNEIVLYERLDGFAIYKYQRSKSF